MNFYKINCGRLTLDYFCTEKFRGGKSCIEVSRKKTHDSFFLSCYSKGSSRGTVGDPPLHWWMKFGRLESGSRNQMLLLQSPFVQYLSRKHYNQMKLFVKLQEVAFIYIYIHIYMCICIFIYMYMYIYMKATPVLQKILKKLRWQNWNYRGAISYDPL